MPYMTAATKPSYEPFQGADDEMVWKLNLLSLPQRIFFVDLRILATPIQSRKPPACLGNGGEGGSVKCGSFRTSLFDERFVKAARSRPVGQ